jgi:hypothetical protein
MANPKPLLKGIVELLSKPKVAAPASAAIYALAPDDVEGSGLLQALKAAKIARQRLADELAARFSDAPGSSIPQRRAEKQLAEMDRQIEMLQKQLEEADQAPAWGATPGAVRIQDMMERYGDPKDFVNNPPKQMELDLRGGATPDIPFMQVPEGHLTDDFYRSRPAQSIDDAKYEAARRKELLRRQMEMNENYPGDYDWD